MLLVGGVSVFFPNELCQEVVLAHRVCLRFAEPLAFERIHSVCFD